MDYGAVGCGVQKCKYSSAASGAVSPGIFESWCFVRLAYFEGPEVEFRNGALRGWRHYLVMDSTGQKSSVLSHPDGAERSCESLRGFFFRAGSWGKRGIHNGRGGAAYVPLSAS